MSVDDATPSIRGDKLIFNQPDQVEAQVEQRLKKRFGRGIFVQDSFENSGGDIAIKFGVSYPKDVSDRRDRDKVMQYINVGDVGTLTAESTGEGFYIIELPDRSDLKEAFHERRKEIANKLDWSMAKTIFDEVYQLEPVRNQLTSLNQIVRWLRKEPELSIQRLDKMQRTQNTEEYLSVLQQLQFVRIDEEEGVVRPGDKMTAAEIMELPIDDYQRVVVGNIVKEGYYILRDRLDLRMLNHYPKFANSYYYSAIQREKPDLWLDKQALRKTLRREWDDDVDPLVLDDKLRKLEEVDVIQTDDDYVTGNTDIYENIMNEAGASAVAD